MNTKLLRKTLLFFTILIFTSSYSQCNNNDNTACNNVNGTYKGTITPTKFEWQSRDFNSGEIGFFEFYALNGVTYEFRTCSDQNMELTIATSGGDNRKEYDSNTYYCSGNGNNEYATYTATSTGTHRVKYSRHGSCSSTNEAGTLEYKQKLLRSDFITQTYVNHTGRDDFWIGNILPLPSGDIGTFRNVFRNSDDIVDFTVEPLNFDRNFDSKGPGGCVNPGNRFAIFYSTYKYFTPGRYKITVGGDDGFAFAYGATDMMFSQTTVIEDWTNGGYRTQSVELDLFGYQSLSLYYYENTGDGRISFKIEKVTTELPLIFGQDVFCQGDTQQLTVGATGGTFITPDTGALNLQSNGILTAVSPTLLSSAAIPRVRYSKNGSVISSRRFIVSPTPTFSASSIQPYSCTGDFSININSYVDQAYYNDPFVWYRNNFNGTTPQVGIGTLSGDAVVNDSSLRLTNNTNNQLGKISINNPGVNAHTTTASFNMYMSGGTGADGVEASYGPIKVFFDSYNNFNGSNNTVETGTTCEPRKTNGQGVGLKVIDTDTGEIVYCSSFSYDARGRWSPVMIIIKQGKLTVIYDSVYILDGLNLSKLNSTTNKSTWKWEFSARTGALNDIHRIDDLSVISYNVREGVYQYSIDSTNGTNGTWQDGLSFTNLESGVYPVYVRAKYPERVLCFSPRLITTLNLTNYYDKIALNTGSWNDTNLWSFSIIPTSSNCVVIPNGVTVTVTSDYVGFANSVTIKPGGKLIIQSGATLRVTNHIVNLNSSAESLTIHSGGNLVQSTDNLIKPNQGSANVFRNSNPMDKYGYTYWSSPVKNQNTITGTPLYTGINNAYKWNYVNGVNGTMSWISNPGAMLSGVGYIARAPQNFAPFNQSTNNQWQKGIVTASFKGELNNGIIPVTIYPHINPLDYTLIGNPYPGKILADRLLNNYGVGLVTGNNQIIVPTLYFWTHASTPIPQNGMYSYPETDYSTYTLLGGTGTAPSINDGNQIRPTGIIAAGQGFFVKGTSTGGTINFNNSYRQATAGQGHFFRTMNAEENQETDSLAIEKHRFWLELKGSNALFKEILIGFSNKGTDELDALDGELNSTSNNQFYSFINDKNYVIQSLPLPFEDNRVIPIGFKVSQTGNYTISLSTFDGLFEEQNIYLRDKLLGTLHNLKNGEYEFYSNSGTFNDRFEIVFSPTLGLNDNIKEESWIVYKSNSEITVETFGFTMQDVSVYDVLGKRIYNYKANDTNHTIPNLNQNQVVIVKVTTNDGIILSKKVIL
jgi:hypothetical protein